MDTKVSNIKITEYKLKRALSLKSNVLINNNSTIKSGSSTSLSSSSSSSSNDDNGRYKTELCHNYAENGQCRYGLQCKFAHGEHEMRHVRRHPRFKTIPCKSFYDSGMCPYGHRCNFIHEDDLIYESAVSLPSSPISKPIQLPSVPNISKAVNNIPAVFDNVPGDHVLNNEMVILNDNDNFDINNNNNNNKYSNFPELLYNILNLSGIRNERRLTSRLPVFNELVPLHSL